MDTQSFCYWLQGFFEISNPKELDARQVQIIKDHLNLVFDKKTPDRNQEPEKNDILETLTEKPYKGKSLLDEINHKSKPFPGEGFHGHGDGPVMVYC